MQTDKTNKDIQAAIAELETHWGYRDISELIAAYKKYLAEHHPDSANTTTYLCVLQTPEGGPVYCKTAQRLYKELETAQTRNEAHIVCPAPDPTKDMWMVVGNFEIDDED